MIFRKKGKKTEGKAETVKKTGAVKEAEAAKKAEDVTKQEIQKKFAVLREEREEERREKLRKEQSGEDGKAVTGKKKKKHKKGKIAAIGAAAVVLTVGGIFGAMKFAGKGSSEGAIYVQKVADLLTYGENTNTRFSGVVESQKAQKIDVDMSKKIEKVYVSEGDQVKKGEKLFEYSVESMELELEQAEIEIEKLKNSITSNESQIAELQKERANAQSTADYMSVDAEIQQLTADNNSAKYDIKLKEAELKQKQKNIKKAAITSPIDGVVKTLNNVESLSEENTTLMTLQTGGDIRIKGKVNEVNIDMIYSGVSVVVRSRIHPEETWMGSVDQVVTNKKSGEGEEENTEDYSDSGSGEKATSYDFYVNLDSTDGLMMGQHITIEPDLGQAKEKKGVWLNSGYLVMDEENEGSAYVWMDNGRGRLTQQSVTLGEYDEDMDEYEITEGLKLDDMIAWPDEDCKSGARTTDTQVWDDGDEDGGEDVDSEDGDGESLDSESDGEMSVGGDMSIEGETFYDDSSAEEVDTEESTVESTTEGEVPSDDELLDNND